MDYFNYRGESLYAENVPLETIAARFGTPCYVYSRATLERHWHAFDRAFNQRPHLICYAVKANSNLAVLEVFARLGSGFDIVSVGELERVLKAGGDPEKIVFSGVGKREAEIRRALEAGIRGFNVEMPGELERLDRIAAASGCRAPVSLRVNPDVDARTHPYIATGLKESKFGIDIGRSPDAFCRAAEKANLDIQGIACHIGSQLTRTAPFLDALDRVLNLVDELETRGIAVHHLDLGGGLGVRYRDETPPAPSDYVAALLRRLGPRPMELLIEPGRAIAANAGVLLTRVEYVKVTDAKSFAIVDAGMNDLLRPSLYNAWQEIIPVRTRAEGGEQCYDVVGPVCETGDFLGRDRDLRIEPGDLLAVRSAGAYGFTMSSNYNSRPRPAEVMVDDARMHLVREREPMAQLWRGEHLLS